MTSRETPLSRPNRTTRIKSYYNKLKHLTLTKDTRWQWNILIPLDWSDTVTSSFTKTSVSTVRKSLGKTVCSRLSSTPLSAGWESIFEKQIRILADAPWKNVLNPNMLKYFVSFSHETCLQIFLGYIGWPIRWMINRKGQSTLTFQQCLIFIAFVFHISSLFDPV